MNFIYKLWKALKAEQSKAEQSTHVGSLDGDRIEDWRLRSEYSAAAQLSSCRQVLLAGIFAVAVTVAVIRIMGLLT